MKIIPTADEIRAELKEEMQCTDEFIAHLTRWGMIVKLKRAIASEDKPLVADLRKEISRTWQDYCKDAGLEPSADNRDAKPKVFI